MNQNISAVSVLVPDYDAGIEFYVQKIGFRLVEDTVMSETKRWVLVSPPGGAGTCLLLAKAETEAQVRAIGNQSGDRVFLFLKTDDFDRDHATFLQAGVRFLEDPRLESYGKVAVFQDPFGNKWDLIQMFDK